jgi:AAT family amino acid transporter
MPIMEPTSSNIAAQEELSIAPTGLVLQPFVFSIAVFFVVHAISLGIWRLFVDAKLAVWKYSPQPFGMYLFWGILVLVFIGFNFGMAGFSTFKQPARGCIATVVTVGLAFLLPGVLVYGYGALDPTFTSVGGVGYGAAGLIVLIGFYGFGILATGMSGWPWSDSGLRPVAGSVAQLACGCCLTGLGYFLLIYPNLTTASEPHAPLLELPVAIGWFYSVIVAWLTTFLIFDNWPWSMLKRKSHTALAALVGNFLLGTALYAGHLALLKWVLIPSSAVEKLGTTLPIWPAQLGVWIAFWLIFWVNVAGNWPNRFGISTNRVIRASICWGLGLISFEVYTRWFAVSVLHEAEIVPGFGGDPLTWVDLLNYVMLIYAVYFEFYGLSKKKSAN